MEPAPDLVRVASGPAHGQVRLIGIEDSDGDPGWRGARHALTILGRHENEKEPMSRDIGSWPYPVPDLNRCYRRERAASRSEEHTSELQSRGHLVCRLLLEKKKEEDAPNRYLT